MIGYKKFYFILLSIFIFSFCTVVSRNPVIYKKSKSYLYEAIYITKNGDTLTKEKILVNPLEKRWLITKQSSIEHLYFPDTLNLKKFEHPITSRQNFRNEFESNIKYKNKNYWITKAKTGIIETRELIWSHPFRKNQYEYTEIAPFPLVYVNKLYIDSCWKGNLIIGSGWDNFQGNVEAEYKVKRKEFYKLDDSDLECWLIESIGKHSVLGESSHFFLFNSEFGFIKSDYTFFDGTKLTFRLKEVKYTER
jgi:hypothetical protein